MSVRKTKSDYFQFKNCKIEPPCLVQNDDSRMQNRAFWYVEYTKLIFLRQKIAKNNRRMQN